MSVTRLKRMVPLAAIVASSLVLADCASTSPSATVDTHPHGVPYLTQSGSGDRTITSVPLPATWSLVWKFSCTDPTTRRSFVLAVSAGGRPPTTVTDQTGLEGGGYHPFTEAGDYTFTVTTSCGWDLLVATAGTEAFPVSPHT